MNYKVILLGCLLLAGAVSVNAAKSYTLQEIYAPENVTVELLAGGNFNESAIKYCFRVVTGGWGHNYYAGSSAMQCVSPPSEEVCAGNPTNSTHKAFRICWDAGNSTGATGHGGDYMIGLYLTKTRGNYSPESTVYDDANVYYDSNFRYHGFLSRKTYVEYMGGNTFCYNFSAFTRRYYRYPLYEDGVPFLDIAGGTTADPITPDDLTAYLDSINRSEYYDRLDTFPNSSMGTAWYLQAFLGGWMNYANDTVFGLPDNTMLYQTWGGLKFQTEYDFQLGTQYYHSPTNTNYLQSLGAVYTRMGVYPSYGTLYGQTGVYGSFLGSKRSGLPYYLNLCMKDHGVQWGGNANLSMSLFQGAGRFSRAVSLRDSIFVSDSPEMGNENDWLDGYNFNPHEFDKSALGRLSCLESAFMHTDASKLVSSSYFYRWVIRGWANSTRMIRFINSKLPVPTKVYFYKQGTDDVQAFLNEEFELSLTVVDSVTGDPIENATLTIQDADGNNAMGGKSATTLASEVNYQLYEFDETYFKLSNPPAFAVGDYLKIGMEFMRVTGVNATGVNVTRGEFNSTSWGLQTIHSNGNASNGQHMKAFQAWAIQHSTANGEFEKVRLVNRSFLWWFNQTGKPINTGYIEDYDSPTYSNTTDGAPFTIKINASGYNNFTTYYTPTQENHFTIGLSNATTCPNCSSNIIMNEFGAGYGVGQAIVRPVEEDETAVPIPEEDYIVANAMPLLMVLGAGLLMGVGAVNLKKEE